MFIFNPVVISLLERFITRGKNQACATHSVYDYAFQQNDGIGGNGVLSVLLAAQLNGNQVTIVGTGTCTIHPTMEDVTNVVLGSTP